MAGEKKGQSLLKPSNIFWMVSLLVFIIIYLYSNKDLDFGKPVAQVTEIHYASAITETHQKLIKQFNEKYRGRIRVVPLDLPFSKFSTNERKELLARALRSKSEKIDLFAVDIVWGFRFAKWAENLTPYFTQDYLDNIIDPIFPTCYYNDSLFAFPFTMDLGSLYYRDDKLAELPDYEEIKTKLARSITWDEFIELGLRLKGNGSPYYLFPASDYEGLICSFTELILNQNRDFFEGDKINLTQPAAIKALEKLYNLIYKYGLTPKIVTAFTEHPCHDYFINNNGYFVRSWPTFFSENLAHLDEKMRENIKRAPLPRFENTKPASVFGGWNLVVSKFSEHKPEVLEFIRFLLKHESQKTMFEGNGSLPVLKSVYQDENVENADALNFYKDIFPYGVHRPMLEDYTRISDIMSYYVHKALTNEMSVKEALSSATEMINSNEVIFK